MTAVGSEAACRQTEDVADPIFILAAPRSFSSVVCAMLGQHPDLYGLPETHLFGDETLAQWFDHAEQESFPMADGLLRAVAELCFKEQTAQNVRRARGWLRRRATFTSGMIFEELAREAHPLSLVDKSPNMVYGIESMRRAQRFFPRARFIHLLRHPRGYCQSVLNYLERLAQARGWLDAGQVPGWINQLASYQYSPANRDPDAETHAELDPQRGWYELNKNIVMFLKSLNPRQWIRVRGEDLLTDPDRDLWQLLRKLGLPADGQAIQRMKHPERSPYASFGPPGARIGNDILFLERPALEPARATVQSLEGPLPWLSDGRGFLSEVKQFARYLGYE